MGLHASPQLAPGAWIAFRDHGDAHPPAGDFSFLMHRVEGVPEDSSTGAQQCGSSPYDGNASVGYGAWCRRLPAGASLFVKLDEAFARGFSGKAHLRLVQSFAVGAALELFYDNGNGSAGRLALMSGSTPPAGTAETTWQDSSRVVDDAVFRQGGVHRADLWVVNRGEEVGEIHMVEVRH